MEQPVVIRPEFNSYKAPVKLGVVVKMGPTEKHVKYLGRLLTSLWGSDATTIEKGTMEILAVGWNCGSDLMSDIFNGRQLGVEHLAKNMPADTVIAVMDNDIELPKEWYKQISMVLREYPEIGAIYPKVEGSFDFTVPRYDQATMLSPQGLKDYTDGKRTDMCVFLHTKMIRESGFFHYSYEYLKYQQEKGWRILVTPFISVTHRKEPEWERP